MAPQTNSAFFLACCTMISSYIINRRGLEDTTHPLWARVVASLCSNDDEALWPTPQWRLYVSRKDIETSSEADSLRTAGDSTARGVITDFCILLPIFEGVPIIAEKTVSDLHKTWDPENIPWYEFLANTDLVHLLAPFLLELKKPVTRSAPNIYKYAECIWSRIEMGKDQVVDQAFCLFCSRKYDLQDICILVAAAGEWFSFCVITREQMTILKGSGSIFALSRYAALISKEQRIEKLLQTGLPPIDHSGDSDSLKPVGAAPNKAESDAYKLERQQKRRDNAAVAETMRKELANKRAQMIQKQNEDRQKRRERRSARAEGMDPPDHDLQNLQKYHQFVESARASPYSDTQIIQFMSLYRLASRSFPLSELNRNYSDFVFDAPAAKSPRPTAMYADFNWSPITRLGSKAAISWFEDIQILLKEITSAASK